MVSLIVYIVCIHHGIRPLHNNIIIILKVREVELYTWGVECDVKQSDCSTGPLSKKVLLPEVIFFIDQCRTVYDYIYRPRYAY